jgi:uncharacterized protein (DUF849 family)
MSPHVPLNHQEIVDEVGRALELGVQMVHLHARDAAGRPTADPEPYGRMIEAIRQLNGGSEIILCVTTSGRADPEFEPRSRVLDLDGAMKPDMATLTLSSLNFPQQASINSPETIRALARRMRERNILPELEIFDLGMANFLTVLQREELVPGQGYVNILLGNIAGAQANPLGFAALNAVLPAKMVVGVAGIGRDQLPANVLGLLWADGVRVGIEDNLWQDVARTIPASNDSLIRRMLTLANTFERPLMTRLALRHRLGLANRCAKVLP